MNEYFYLVFIVLGFSIFLGTILLVRDVSVTGSFGLQEEYVSVDSNCWTCNEHLAIPRVEPQDKKLVIIDLNA